MSTDNDLVLDAKRGDTAAKLELIRRHKTRVWVFLRRGPRAPGDPMDAEDLLQVAALGVLEAVERFDPDRGIQFGTYAAFRIYAAVRRARKDYLAFGHPLPQIPRPDPRQRDPADEAAARELLACAGQLGPHARQFLRGRLDGETRAAIARRLCLSKKHAQQLERKIVTCIRRVANA